MYRENNPTKRLQNSTYAPLISLNMFNSSVIIPPSVIIPLCPSITVADIATNNSGTWYLNAPITILACQTLIIPVGVILNVGFTITNNGRIDVNGGTLNFNANISMINNGALYIYNSGMVTGSISAIVTNNGIIKLGNVGDSCGIGNFYSVQITTNAITYGCPPI